MIKSDYFSEEFIKILDHFLSIKSTSERGRVEYAKIFRMVCDYLCMDFLELTYTNVEPFLQYQVNKIRSGKLTKETYNVRRSACNSLANFITEEYPGLNFENPFSNHIPYEVNSLTIPARSVPSLSDIDKLLEACKDNDKAFLIVSLALRMALTTSEIISLKTSNIQIVDGKPCVVLLDKYRGTINRVLQIPEDIYPLLESFMLANSNTTTETIFLTKNGSPYSVRSLDKLILKREKQAGISCSLQALRSRAILEMTKNAQSNGVDLSSVGNYVGVGPARLNIFSNTDYKILDAPTSLSMIRIVKE